MAGFRRQIGVRPMRYFEIKIRDDAPGAPTQLASPNKPGRIFKEDCGGSIHEEYYSHHHASDAHLHDCA